MTLLTLLQSFGAPIPTPTAVGNSKRKKYVFDYAFQAKVNMHILMLSI
jgi:hypothetical protein